MMIYGKKGQNKVYIYYGFNPKNIKNHTCQTLQSPCIINCKEIQANIILLLSKWHHFHPTPRGGIPHPTPPSLPPAQNSPLPEKQQSSPAVVQESVSQSQSHSLKLESLNSPSLVDEPPYSLLPKQRYTLSQVAPPMYSPSPQMSPTKHK